MTDMTQLLHSMENTMKLQARASAERRARKAEQEKREFLEKLGQGVGRCGAARSADRHDAVKLQKSFRRFGGTPE